jgi:ectoine hydroxylase-related dioxygenase (phytanoyl-CoA dioxygenase family)
MEVQDQIKQQGFAILPPIVPAERLHKLAEECGRLESRSRAGVRHAMHFDSARSLSHYQPLSKLAREILGPSAFPFRATLFDKSPEANWLVVWHQDTALPLRDRIDAPGWGPWSTKAGIPYAHAPGEVLSQVLAIRVHLDDSTEENGPLRVLPGTHTLGVLSDDRIHELAELTSAVDCVVPKGGVLAMRPLIIHASSKSRALAPRRVLHIEYAASESIANPLQLAIA